jgi:glucose-6-phosphate 1-dehydrogenase
MASLLLFGATGDLSKRMLLPSLFGLHADGLLPAGLAIVATARSGHDTAAYRALANTRWRQRSSRSAARLRRSRRFWTG